MLPNKYAQQVMQKILSKVQDFTYTLVREPSPNRNADRISVTGFNQIVSALLTAVYPTSRMKFFKLLESVEISKHKVRMPSDWSEGCLTIVLVEAVRIEPLMLECCIGLKRFLRRRKI